VLFLLDTGVSVAECSSVLLEDIDWGEGRVLIQGKGNKQMYVGIGGTTAASLRGYVDRFRGDEPGPLFLTRARQPFADLNALRVLLRRLAARAGVENVHPHRFRRTFATWALESGAQETDVMLLLGRTTLAMTHHYAQTYTSQQGVRAHSLLSPVARLSGLE
jgi:integrase